MENFEEKLNRLEQLSEKIKSSDISLEEAVKTFEEGIKLSKGLEAELGKIESKIQILINNPLVEPDDMNEAYEKTKKTEKKPKAKNASETAVAEPELSLFSIDE